MSLAGPTTTPPAPVSLQAEFKAACDGVKTFEPTKAVPNESKLAMYSLFKQATIGDCNTDRPGIFDFEGSESGVACVLVVVVAGGGQERCCVHD